MTLSLVFRNPFLVPGRGDEDEDQPEVEDAAVVPFETLLGRNHLEEQLVIQGKICNSRQQPAVACKQRNKLSITPRTKVSAKCKGASGGRRR